MIRDGLARRRQRQPLGRRTSGSVYLPAPDGTPAAILIEQSEVKTMAVGGARISPRHCNWIEANDGCTSTDIEALIHQTVEQVASKTGIWLEREIHLFPDESSQLQT